MDFKVLDDERIKQIEAKLRKFETLHQEKVQKIERFNKENGVSEDFEIEDDKDYDDWFLSAYFVINFYNRWAKWHFILASVYIYSKVIKRFKNILIILRIQSIKRSIMETLNQ